MRGNYPPGPRGPGFIQALKLDRDPVAYHTGLNKRYGDVYTVNFPTLNPYVFLARPDLVKEMFTGDPRIFHAGEANVRFLGHLMGFTAMLMKDDEPHMAQRKLLLPPFHGEAIHRWADAIRDLAEWEIERWPENEPFELLPHFQDLARAVILRVVFGVRSPERMREALDLIARYIHVSHWTVLYPFMRHRFLGVGPFDRWLRMRRKLEDFMGEEIAARRAELEAGEENDDVLTFLLRATYEDGTGMSHREIVDELGELMVAGAETSGTTLTWGIERVLRTPRVLERLLDSVEAGEDEYLDAMVKETLRIRPVFTDVNRKLKEPVEIGGHHIPKDSICTAAILAIHFREDVYTNPYEFRPERFLEGEGKGYAWIPFGGGIRRCVGAAFTQLEIKIIWRTIFETLEVEAVDPRPEKLSQRLITYWPDKGAKVRVRRLARERRAAAAPEGAPARVPQPL